MARAILERDAQDRVVNWKVSPWRRDTESLQSPLRHGKHVGDARFKPDAEQ